MGILKASLEEARKEVWGSKCRINSCHDFLLKLHKLDNVHFYRKPSGPLALLGICLKHGTSGAINRKFTFSVPHVCMELWIIGWYFATSTAGFIRNPSVCPEQLLYKELGMSWTQDKKKQS